MKLTVIGYWGGFPAAGGASSGYLLQHDGFNLLVDCGSAVLSKLQSYIAIGDLNAVILSHYHYDHIADIGPLKYACLINSKLGKIKGTLDIYGHTLDEKEFNSLSMDTYTRGVPYYDDRGIEIGPFKIKFQRTKHPVSCYAMRIEAEGKSLVYTGDGSYAEELMDFSRDADVLLCECNFYEGESYPTAGHMNSLDAALLARKSGVRKLILTHLPHYGHHNELLSSANREFKGEIELAKEGLVISL